jgi:GNAT superfamily N-acetyltransferase
MDEYISELDTQRFGFPIARVNAFSEPMERILDGLQNLGVRMVISRVPADLINEMEQAGFRLKDIQVTYNYDLPSPPPALDTRYGIIYRKFRPGDEDAIQRIASQAFRNYGHYAKNRELGRVDTGEIYADWARRCCAGLVNVDRIIVAEHEDIPVGYLAFQILEDGDSRYAAGVMGAVDKKAQRAGVFRGINIMGLRWALEQGLNRVEHNVLLTNYAVNKTYSGLGFRIIRSEVTLHCKLAQ